MMGIYKIYTGFMALLLTALPIFYSYSVDLTHQKKDIAQSIHLYYKMLDEGRYQSAILLVSENCTLFSDDGKELIQSTEQTANHQPFTSHHILYLDIRVVGNSAIATYELVTSLNQSTQKQAILTKSVVTSVLECTNEQWKFVHHHYTKTQ